MSQGSSTSGSVGRSAPHTGQKAGHGDPGALLSGTSSATAAAAFQSLGLVPPQGLLGDPSEKEGSRDTQSRDPGSPSVVLPRRVSFCLLNPGSF